jgi:hypothetical protein
MLKASEVQAGGTGCAVGDVHATYSFSWEDGDAASRAKAWKDALQSAVKKLREFEPAPLDMTQIDAATAVEEQAKVILRQIVAKHPALSIANPDTVNTKSDIYVMKGNQKWPVQIKSTKGEFVKWPAEHLKFHVDHSVRGVAHQPYSPDCGHAFAFVSLKCPTACWFVEPEAARRLFLKKGTTSFTIAPPTTAETMVDEERANPTTQSFWKDKGAYILK